MRRVKVKENSMAINFNDEETIICFNGARATRTIRKTIKTRGGLK